MVKKILFVIFIFLQVPSFAQIERLELESKTLFSDIDREKLDSIKIGFFEEKNDHSVHTINQRI